MANRLLAVAVLFLASCSTMPPAVQCAVDADCGEGLVCTSGRCVAGVSSQCTDGDTKPCGPDPVGACRRGIRTCTNGAFDVTCVGQVTPTAETCNAIDDDCDGQVDDGVSQTFYIDHDGDGFGSSAADAQTQQACAKPAGFSASNTDCDDAHSSINTSATEVCDPANVDEDCDGLSNEGCSCQNVGASQACCAGRGLQTCEARPGGASLSACTVVPATEVCNAIDDDCDGQTDELYSLASSDGGAVVLSDGGVIELDGGCAVGIGACAPEFVTISVAARAV